MSARLTVLHRTGLATAHRVGHQIHYSLTRLGRELAGPFGPTAPD